MSATWRLFVDQLKISGTEITVPAHVDYWPDGVDPAQEASQFTWPLQVQMGPNIYGSQTTQQTVLYVVNLLKTEADVIKQGYETWQAIKAQGGQQIQGWP